MTSHLNVFGIVIGGAILLVLGLVVSSRSDGFRKMHIARCAALVTEGLEAETKWSDNFGCLVKRDGKWVR